MALPISLELDWLQSLKQFFINVSYNILVASLTLMALFEDRAIRVRLATSILYDTLMKNCFKDWSQSTLESHGIFGSTFAYLVQPLVYMRNGDEDLRSHFGCLRSFRENAHNS